jgi:hypothetical protein
MLTKIFSALRSRRPLTRSDAWTYAIINQFATPGLGSLLARRFVAGGGQLLLACAGFALFIAWFIQTMRVFYGQMFGTELAPDTGSSLWKWGLGIFAAAWLWSLVTSIQIIRSAPKDTIPPLPPKIS